MYCVSSWPRNCWFFRLLLMVVMAGMIRPRVTRNSAGPRQMTTAIGFCSRPVALPATKKTITRIAMKPPTASITPSNVVAAWPAVLDAIRTYAVATTGSLSCLTSSKTVSGGTPGCFGPRGAPRGPKHLRCRSCRAGDSLGRPGRVNLLGDIRTRLAAAEPVHHRLPLRTRTDGGRHGVRGVEPERGLPVGQVLRRDLVDRVGVQALVDLLVGRHPARGNLDPALSPLRARQVVLHSLGGRVASERGDELAAALDGSHDRRVHRRQFEREHGAVRTDLGALGPLRLVERRLLQHPALVLQDREPSVLERGGGDRIDVAVAAVDPC